jgi:hypothetical protein
MRHTSIAHNRRRQSQRNNKIGTLQITDRHPASVTCASPSLTWAAQLELSSPSKCKSQKMAPAIDRARQTTSATPESHSFSALTTAFAADSKDSGARIGARHGRRPDDKQSDASIGAPLYSIGAPL